MSIQIPTSSDAPVGGIVPSDPLSVAVPGGTPTVQDSFSVAGIPVTAADVDAMQKVLMAGDPHSAEQAIQELMGNPCLHVGAIVALFVNILEAVEIDKNIETAEGKLTAAMVRFTMQIAEDIGHSIMDKAKKERDLYIAMGIAGFASLAVCLVGFGVSCYGAKMQTQGTALKEGQAPAAGTSQSQVDTKTQGEAMITRGKTFASGGENAMRMAATVEHIMQNFMQAGAKIPIAEQEKLQQLLQALSTTTRTILDSSQQQAQQARSLIDSMLQALEKASDLLRDAFSSRA